MKSKTLLSVLIGIFLVFSLTQPVEAKSKHKKHGKAHQQQQSYGLHGEDPCFVPPGLAKQGKTPPGLAKQGKTPPGWSKKCRGKSVKRSKKYPQQAGLPVPSVKSPCINPGDSTAEKVIIGGSMGAVIGGIAGSSTGNEVEGAVFGAVVGGIIGAAAGEDSESANKPGKVKIVPTTDC